MKKVKNFGFLLTGALIFSMMFTSVSAFAQRGGAGGGGAPAPGLPAPAAAPTGMLEVTVLGPLGAPEKDVNVTVVMVGATKGKSKKSNMSGVSLLDKLDNGLYRIVGRKKGFEPALYEYVALSGGKESVTLRLAGGADRKLYFEDQTLERQATAFLNEGMAASTAAESEKIIARSMAIRPSAPDAHYYYGVALASQGKFEQASESFRKTIDIATLLLSTMPKPKPMGFGPGGPGGPPGGAPKPGGPPGGASKPGVPPGGASKPGVPPGEAPKPGLPGGPGGAPKPSTPSNREIYEQLIEMAEIQIATIPVIKGDTAYEAKRFDEAIALYDESIKLHQQNPLAYSNRALALMQSGRLDEAVASVNKALEISPGDERAEQVKKAVEAFIQNAEREKENAVRKQANDILNEGNKLLETDASAALKKFEEANTLTGEQQSVIWRQVGRAHAKLQQDTQAVSAFRRAIEFAAEDQIEYYQMSLAQYYLDSKKPEEALDVVVAGSKNPEQRLMDLYTKGKNNPDSMAFSTAALERVVTLNPSNIDAVFELGQVYYIDRKDSQAQELLTRYVENGKDDVKIQTAQDLLTVLASRNKK